MKSSPPFVCTISNSLLISLLLIHFLCYRQNDISKTNISEFFIFYKLSVTSQCLKDEVYVQKYPMQDPSQSHLIYVLDFHSFSPVPLPRVVHSTLLWKAWVHSSTDALNHAKGRLLHLASAYSSSHSWHLFLCQWFPPRTGFITTPSLFLLQHLVHWTVMAHWYV